MIEVANIHWAFAMCQAHLQVLYMSAVLRGGYIIIPFYIWSDFWSKFPKVKELQVGKPGLRSRHSDPRAHTLNLYVLLLKMKAEFALQDLIKSSHSWERRMKEESLFSLLLTLCSIKIDLSLII